MREFKIFQGYADRTPSDDAFERLMNSFQELDAMINQHNQNNYEIPEELSDWDVTLNDGLGEEQS